MLGPGNACCAQPGPPSHDPGRRKKPIETFPFAYVFPIFFLLLWLAVSFFVACLGGWRELARHYRAGTPFLGKKFWFQSARLKRWTNYNNALTVGGNPQGLYLSQLVIFRFGHPPLFMPWTDITVLKIEGRLGSRYELRFARCPEVPFTITARLWDRLGPARQENAPITP